MGCGIQHLDPYQLPRQPESPHPWVLIPEVCPLVLLEQRSQPDVSGRKSEQTPWKGAEECSHRIGRVLPAPAGLPGYTLPALSRELDSADWTTDPEGLLSWHLTDLAGQEGEGHVFLSRWRNGGCGTVRKPWQLWEHWAGRARREKLSVSGSPSR